MFLGTIHMSFYQYQSLHITLVLIFIQYFTVTVMPLSQQISVGFRSAAFLLCVERMVILRAFMTVVDPDNPAYLCSLIWFCPVHLIVKEAFKRLWYTVLITAYLPWMCISIVLNICPYTQRLVSEEHSSVNLYQHTTNLQRMSLKAYW